MRLFNWPFGDLNPHSYDMIMADPPWAYELYSDRGEHKSPQAQYSCMSIEDIKGLPVLDLAADNCLLWLWITNPMLPQGLEVLSAWGFTFKTAGTWGKTTKHGKWAFGTGYIFRCASEQILIGTRGKPKTTRSTRSLILGEVREHSRKPEAAFTAAEKLMPSARRLELFSRSRRKGWDTWGDQPEHFVPEVAYV